MKYVIAVDQSTQSTKAVLFDEEGRIKKRVDKKHRQIVNDLGWVSHDPEEILANTMAVVQAVVIEAGIKPEEVVCLGISNQRETTVLFDHKGHPLADAVVWQCARAAEIAKRFKEQADLIFKTTGLPLSPYFPACKMKWLLENTEHTEDYLFGTMDTWLLYRLTNGKSYATDATNASRTQLYDLNTGTWSKPLCALFGIEEEHLPEILDSDAEFGTTDVGGFFAKPIPILSMIGDSHAALFGQGCHEVGQVKTTLGTGSSIMMNIGRHPRLSTNGLTTSLAWSRNGIREFVFEGNINYAGAIITWLQEDLKLIENPGETAECAKRANPMDQTVLVPAFSGLGAPYWVNSAQAMFCGMTRTTRKDELVKAGVEAIAYQITDVLNAMAADSSISIQQVKTDGGPSKNEYLMQFLSEMARTTVCASSEEELSAIGAAYMAGLKAGVYEEKKLFENRQYRQYRYTFDTSIWKERMDRWYHAIAMLDR